MYDPRNILKQQPVAVAAAVRGVLYALVLLKVIQLDPDQLVGIAIALELVLGLFVWNAVTPTDKPTLKAGTEVSVEGTTDTNVIGAVPPGPTGVEGGSEVSG